MIKEVYKKERLDKDGMDVIGTVEIQERVDSEGEEYVAVVGLINGIPRKIKVLGPHSSVRLLVSNMKKRIRRLMRHDIQYSGS